MENLSQCIIIIILIHLFWIHSFLNWSDLQELHEEWNELSRNLLVKFFHSDLKLVD